MKKLIKDTAYIQTGLFAKPSGTGELVYLQSKHFDEYGQLHALLHPDLDADGISDKHLLRDGDVLFAAKGTKNFATVFENHHEPAVASTSFFVIRPTDKNLLPQYLAWILNADLIERTSHRNIHPIHIKTGFRKSGNSSAEH